MIIDFHTHAYSDDIAPLVFAKLMKNAEGYFVPDGNLTISSLLEHMDKNGINVSVLHTVVTKASQFEKANLWAKSVRSERIIPFGAMYPHTDDYRRDIDFLVEMGFPGVKFHAEYQDFELDAPFMMKIYDYALSQGLMILHHAGADPAAKPPYKSSPQQFAKVMQAMPGGIIIAAHFGGHKQWADVEKHLAGTEIYLDTSMGFAYFGEEQFRRILEKHGADRVLFATDSPWSNSGQERKSLQSLGLPKDDEAKILGGNARRLLGI